MFGSADPGLLALRPGYPNLAQPVGQRGRHRERIATNTVRSGPSSSANRPRGPWT